MKSFLDWDKKRLCVQDSLSQETALSQQLWLYSKTSGCSLVLVMGSADEMKHIDQIISSLKKSRFHVYTGGMSWSFNQNFI